MLHNKYLPKTFDEMVGNPEIISKFKEYEKTGFPHCILLYGKHGMGKSTTASIMQRGIPDCTIELTDGGVENGISKSREIAGNINNVSLGYKNKIILLEEAHQGTAKFFDALLIATNKPPNNVYFVICTTNLDKIPPTIRSRFIKFRFEFPDIKITREYLNNICEKEGIHAGRHVLTQICKKNSNGIRDCLTDLELLIGVESEKEQLVLLEREMQESATGYEIAKALGDWETVRSLLKTVGVGDIEGVRRTVLSYHVKVLLNSKKEDDPINDLVLDSFKEVMYDSGIAGLTLACWNNC